MGERRGEDLPSPDQDRTGFSVDGDEKKNLPELDELMPRPEAATLAAGRHGEVCIANKRRLLVESCAARSEPIAAVGKEQSKAVESLTIGSFAIDLN